MVYAANLRCWTIVHHFLQGQSAAHPICGVRVAKVTLTNSAAWRQKLAIVKTRGGNLHITTSEENRQSPLQDQNWGKGDECDEEDEAVDQEVYYRHATPVCQKYPSPSTR